MGSEAELDPRAIPRVAKEMSEKSRKSIFGKESTANSTVVKKVINNPKIALTPL